VTTWQAIVRKDLPALNALLVRNHAAAIPVPQAGIAVPVCGAGVSSARDGLDRPVR